MLHSQIPLQDQEHKYDKLIRRPFTNYSFIFQSPYLFMDVLHPIDVSKSYPVIKSRIINIFS